MIELEKTYLAKSLPADLQKYPSREIIDIYIPESFDHPKIRIRKNGSKFEITKKEPVKNDPSHQLEQTIAISETEFEALALSVKGKRVRKIRYNYDYQDQIAEFDLFQDSLSGLVLVDFEFKNSKDKQRFVMPDFCLVEITNEQFVAGGMICGKSYEEIEIELKRFKYSKIS